MKQSRPLSVVLMDATECACQAIAMAEEAADHYGYALNDWDRWCRWWQGLVAGMLDDYRILPLTDRLKMSLATRLRTLFRPGR